LTTRCKKTVLDNGMRILSETVPSVRSVSLGVWIDTGSRNETIDINGISHFIEHMVFKGTKTRSAQQIAASLESVGGHLNAFTSREQTCYYAKVLDEHLPNAMEVISDIIQNSLFDESEIAKEKNVIIEEINDVEDAPSELIHDIFAATIWKDNPMGFPIMGNADTVNGIKRNSILNYIGNNYTPDRIIVSACGHLEHDELLKISKDQFKFAKSVDTKLLEREVPQIVSQITCRQKDISQAHISMGFPTIEFSDDRRGALLLLNNILGGGMSSRLFQTVREQAGLVYTIFSFIDFYIGTGLMGSYFATSGGQISKALELIYKVFNQMKDNSLTDQELYYAKAQLKGNLVLGLENTSNRMNRLARQEILLGKFLSIDDTIASIDAVTVKDVIDVANLVLDPTKITIAALGQVEEKELIPYS